MRLRLWVCLVLAAAACCSGCMPASAVREDVPDHFERLNRGVYKFNRALDKTVVRPIARGYNRFMPTVVDRHMRNFFTNLSAPIDIVNNFLQGKFKPGFSDVGRFLLNTVAGAGFFDPARKIGLERHEEDFGQTLAVWGVPSGGPLMLPILGMGTVRDWAGWVTLDLHTDVLWFNDSGAAWGLLLWRYTSDRAALLSSEAALEGSFDEYALIRKAYLQRRRYQVFDGAPPEDDQSLDPSLDPSPDAPPDAASPDASPEPSSEPEQ
jgi:phospholipid-binding lipoprotein MlaA